MSNGDDVLDNWEEIDEAGLNSPVQALKTSSASCEQIAESIYQTVNLATSTPPGPNLMKVLQRSNVQEPSASSTKSQPLTKSPLDDMSATFQPVMMVLHKPQDEYQSANYTAPIANQTVKILRRPTQSNETRNNFIRPKQPIKTLQQREQEYAEARLRILGAAKNPEDEEQRTLNAAANSVVTTTTTPTCTVSSTVVLSNNSITSTVPTTKVNSPKIQYNNYYNQQLQQPQQQTFQQSYHPQQQQQQQNYFYIQQQQQQQSPSPAYNNNRTYNMNPLLALGPMGAIGQPAQYHTTLPSTQTQQQHLKYQQYNQKSPQQQHKPQHQQHQTWSPVVGGSVSSSSIRQQQNDTILRLPRGPDGGTGFQVRR